MNKIELLQRKALVDDLFYLLAGLDTSNTFVSGNPPVITSTYDLTHFTPFEFLIFKVREFYRIELFDSFVQKYLNKLAELKEKIQSPEELFVALQDEMVLFKELERINTIVKTSADFPFSTHVKALGSIDKDLIRSLQNKEITVIYGLIERWINQADPSTLIEVKIPNDFISSHWKDMFKIKQIGLPKTELEGIETAGKVVFFVRMIFGIEIIDDSISEQQCIMKRRLPPKSPMKKPEITTTTADVQFENNADILTEEHNCSKVESEDNNRPVGLLPFKYQGEILGRRTELLSILNSMVSEQLSIELRLIEEVVLLQNPVLLTKIMEKFQTQWFIGVSIVRELNACYRESVFSNTEFDSYRILSVTTQGHTTFDNTAFISFEQCESTLGEYIMKLQKFQRSAQKDKFLTNIQQIGITFKNGLLQYFVPEQTYFELKILFRFLFSVASSLFYLQRCECYNFTRVIYLIFTKIRSDSLEFLSEIFRTDTWGRSYCFSLDNFPNDFANIISGYMKKFYITNSDVFPIWTRFIDVCLSYLQIEYKDLIVESEYDLHVRECVTAMIEQITKSSGECEFTEFLKNLEVEKYL